MRLVLELWRTREGYCKKGEGRAGGGLADEPGLVPAGIEQAIHRLRVALQSSLGELDPKQYIETSRGKVRLSTTPALIRVDLSSLKEHQDERAGTSHGCSQRSRVRGHPQRLGDSGS